MLAEATAGCLFNCSATTSGAAKISWNFKYMCGAGLVAIFVLEDRVGKREEVERQTTAAGKWASLGFQEWAA